MFLILAGCSQNEYPLSEADTAPPQNPRVAEPIVEGEEAVYEEEYQQEPESRVLHGNVILPEELKEHFTPGMILFVIARDPDAEDSMPLAAKKIRVESLPHHFDLSDEDSLSDRPLPDLFQLIVRLDADGDLTTADPVDLTAGPVDAAMGGHVDLLLEEISQ